MPTTVAPSVKAMFTEANRLWPNRSKASDGTVGDARHRAQGGDHNPDSRGIVHAGDLTNDPVHGVDCNVLVARLVARRDPRVKYIIWNRRIWRSYDRPATRTRPFLPAWKPEAYTGSNPHDHHAHVSTLSGPAAENDTRPWWAVTPKEAMMRVPNAISAVMRPGHVGQVWVLGTDGGVFTFGGAPFFGSYPGLKPEQRQGERAFLSIDAWPDGNGYLCLADDGGWYSFRAPGT